MNFIHSIYCPYDTFVRNNEKNSGNPCYLFIKRITHQGRSNPLIRESNMANIIKSLNPRPIIGSNTTVITTRLFTLIMNILER